MDGGVSELNLRFSGDTPCRKGSIGNSMSNTKRRYPVDPMPIDLSPPLDCFGSNPDVGVTGPQNTPWAGVNAPPRACRDRPGVELESGCRKFPSGRVWKKALGPLPIAHRASNVPYHFSFLKRFKILGIKNEKTNSATEKSTLNEISLPQSPEAQTSFNVPMKKVKMKVPTMIPKPVPQK